MQKRKKDIFYKKLGENIRAVRDRENVKQESVAQVLGLTRISISNIENGIQRIQLHNLVELANYLKEDVSSLIPPLPSLSRTISTKQEKSIANAEISKNKESVEKVKDFIKLSVSTNQQ